LENGIADKLNIRKNLYLHENAWENILPQAWTNIEPQANGPGTPGHGDLVHHHFSQAFTLSSDQTNNPGKAITFVGQSPFANDSIGLCTCIGFGGFEIGGGFIPGSEIRPVAPGEHSILARMRVMFPQGTNFFGETNGYVGADYQLTHYAANGALSDLFNGTGSAYGSQWLVQPASDNAGHMIYGPYHAFGNTSFGSNNNEVYALFRLAIDSIPVPVSTDPNDPGNAPLFVPVVDLDVFDATTGTVIASRTLTRLDFTVKNAAREFVVPIDLHHGGVDRTSHLLETRVYWRDVNANLAKEVVIIKGQ
jgi:hypothetical protein